MSDIPTRYWPTNGPNYEATDGQFVLYTDYAELLAENKRMHEALEKIARYDDEPIWFDDRDDAADGMLHIARAALGEEEE